MRGKKVLPYLTVSLVSLLVGVAIVAFLLRPQVLEIGTVDLSTVADGAYIGVCQNKILFAVVRVTVQEHKLVDIEVIAHKETYLEQAKQIAGAVCAKQSLAVEAISGATLTSDTVLKAIENALEDTALSSRK